MSTISILSHNLPTAIRELDKLARKANRYGGEQITYRVGDTYRSTQWIRGQDGHDYRVNVEKVDITVTGDAPRVSGWEFKAHLERTPAGNLVDTVPGAVIPEQYRYSDGECQHCNTKRARKDLYVLQHEDGRWIQVGRTCLRDFLGIDSPDAVLGKYRFLRSLGGLEDEWGGWSEQWAHPVELILRITATAIRLYGWCSKAHAEETGCEPTANIVEFGLRSPAGMGDNERKLWNALHAAQENDREQARAALEWAQALEAHSDYEHNIKVVCAAEMCFDPRRIGLIASVVGSWQRVCAKRAEAKPAGPHFGDAGKRFRNVTVTVERVLSLGFGSFGERFLLSFRTEGNSQLVWFTDRTHELQIGDTVELTATVKEHGEFNGNPQTVITRAVLA